MRRASLAVAVALVALSAVGCGSASKSSTMAQFTEQANEICVRLSQEQGAIEARTRTLGRADPRQALARQWREAAVVSRAADAGIQALPRPPAQADTITHLVAGYFEEANDEERLAEAYASGDSVAGRAASRAFIGLAKRDAAVAGSLGMTDCAKAESESGSAS